MKKKILSICLVAIIAITAIAGASLAYLTDRDSAENVFTIGNVEIKLLETTLHRDMDAAKDDEIIANAKNYQDYLAEAGKNMVPGRWVMKAPYVQNTGKNAAYIRVVATMTEKVYNAINIMLYTTATEEGAIDFDTENYSDIVIEDGTVTLTFVYTEALEPGAITYYAPFWRFQVMPELDNEDLADLAAEGVENLITVRADAIQAEGFDNADDAFAAFDAQNKD